MNKFASAIMFVCLSASSLTPASAEDAAATGGTGGRPAAPTEAAPDWQGTALSGDWRGARQRLFEAGVQVDLGYTASHLYNRSGGLKKGSADMGHADLVFQFDGEKLFGWRGGSASLHLVSNSGGRFNLHHAGSLMGVDNLEAPVNRSGVFKAWLQQSFFADKASLRAGLYPVDSEFYVTESSSVFLHPSFGMAAEVSSFGTRAGPPIYVTSSYGARLRVDPDPAWYVMLALARGISTERIAAAGPNLSWQKSTGSMLISEVGFSPGKVVLYGEQGPEPANSAPSDAVPMSKIAFGAWRFSPRFRQVRDSDVDGETPRATHWGAYLLAEQTLYRPRWSNGDVTGFVRYGFNDGRTTTVDYSLSAGLSIRGLLPGRERDVLGFAATRGHVGRQARAQLLEETGSALPAAAETAVELTYRAQLAAGVFVQPVVQRIFHPSLTLPHSTVTGIRLQLAL